MLTTKWTNEIDFSNPLPEYPRPQFVRDSYLNLNGVWNCLVTEQEGYPTRFPNSINVPFSPETELSGLNHKLMPNEYIYYKKIFVLPDGFNKGGVFINFGAVDQIATVYLNRKEVETHRGGYTPFKFDITQYLKKGKNTLVVGVKDMCEYNEFSRGKQKTNRGGIWYSQQSGIWQSVWLESMPVGGLESVRITPDYDNSSVRFDYKGCQDVEVRIYDGMTLIAKSKKRVVKIPNFKSWSPERPYLYKVVFRARGEYIKSYFGMRKFSIDIDGNGIKRLFLNNKPYFYNGLLDQGYYPDGYLTPPSNEAMENDVLFAKEAGFNMLRKHIKIEPLLWYHYCDVHGIVVWQDMVNGGGKYGLEVSVLPFIGINLDDTNYKTFHRKDEKARKLYYKELEEMIDHLYNCPCIAAWVPFNEGWGQFDSANAYEFIKKLDKTRIVDTCSGWHDRGKTDVISKHIYFTPIKVKAGDKPYVLSEFGGLGLKISSHTFNDRMFGYKIYHNKMSLTKAYERLYRNTIIPQIKKGLSACVYTQISDVEDELNGLMTYDRKVIKIDVAKLKEINEEVKI
ncbi:MAG: glycoside hydrolase family 2 [Clostridiales bacterium]|nr:glycoside hydrolase family 2 [Clostridiales bacterium]